jgi:hypothetical protein
MIENVVPTGEGRNAEHIDKHGEGENPWLHNRRCQTGDHHTATNRAGFLTAGKRSSSKVIRGNLRS